MHMFIPPEFLKLEIFLSSLCIEQLQYFQTKAPAMAAGVMTVTTPENYQGGTWEYKTRGHITRISLLFRKNVLCYLCIESTSGQPYKFISINNPQKYRITEFELNTPGEHLIGIRGSSSWMSIDNSSERSTYITSLSFLTSNLREYGPYGTETGETFSHTATTNGQITGRIIGFNGHTTRNYISSIRIYVNKTAPVQPPRPPPTIKSALYGGPGGRSYNFCEPNSPIKAITIVYGDDAIYSIIFDRVSDFTGNLIPEKFGDAGTNPGRITTKVDIDFPWEYVKEIKVTTGKYRRTDNVVVKSISIHTNKFLYGPFGGKKPRSLISLGRSKDSTFSLTRPGAIIVGFHARAGSRLEAIGVHFKNIN